MNSESEDEDFIIYGTPLEPLSEDVIPRKRAFTVEDQFAKDKHGRRRFHGAFTGGFSAGFFNSVGSLEGWKPSQFTSSRSERTKAQLQNAEDFMDDEDMDEFGIAPKTLQPRSNYDQANTSSSRKRMMMQHSDGPIPGVPLLKSLIEPVRETIGVRLLIKMGWRSGQGVGPRQSKSEKAASKKHHVKIYGCTLPSNDDTKDEESEEDAIPEDVTFAPDDYESCVVKSKDNCFGLGYSGLDRRTVLSNFNLFGSEGPSLTMEEKKKKVSIRGQAFGVGAFENEDDDIYAKEDMSQYDFALDTPKMMAEKRSQERKNSRLAIKSSSSSGILEGFIAVSQTVMQKAYPPPALPQGFQPVYTARQSRFSAVVDTPTQTSRLTATERAVMVNTEAPPAPPSTTSTSEKKVSVSPAVEAEKTAGSFRPFVADPDKQARYEQFLSLSRLGQAEKLRSLQPVTMTEWEADRERAEFEQAARLYRPLSAAFSDRFVSASQPDDATDPLAPVARSAGADQDVIQAAKLKMFGRLTRRVGEWHPHATLCKRFNIPQPGRSNSVTTAKTGRPKFSMFNFLDTETYNATKESSPNDDTSQTSSSSQVLVTAAEPVQVTEDTVVVDEKIEKLTESTNKMDLYKAIFLSSSDESEAEDDKQTSAVHPGVAADPGNNNVSKGIFANLETLNSQSTKASAADTLQKKSLNVLRNTSPPRGIFANLDHINEQCKRLPSVTSTDENKMPSQFKSVESEAMKTDIVSNMESALEISEVYGPPLPQVCPPSIARSVTTDVRTDSDSDMWVEMDRLSESTNSSDNLHKQLHKKKHSKKSHRKSKKHKEKKKHRHKNKSNK